MKESVIRFADIDWEEVAPHARQKVVKGSEKKLRLLELTPGFEEADWCRTGHTGFVVSGEFLIQFSDRTEEVAQGDAIHIESGEGSKHKAIVKDRPVVLFLLEDSVC